MDDPILAAATRLAEATDTDVILYSGDIERPWDNKLLDMLASMNRRRNVLLLLCTRGGNPDAAYRIARGLQENYENFTILLAGRCKSAGTLLAVGAHELVMTAHAELGPLDIQLGKKDELFETDSGLTVLNALTELEGKAFELFEKAFLRIKVRSEGSVTFKTAAHIAMELAKGVVAPIMAQIDPMHVGEVTRAMEIGRRYAERLSEVSGSLHPDALDKLVNNYPSHGFVIDRKEAEELFLNIREIRPEEAELIKLQPLRSAIRSPKRDEAILTLVSEARKESRNDSHNAQNSGEGPVPNGEGTAPDEEAIRSEKPEGLGTISEILSKHRTGTE